MRTRPAARGIAVAALLAAAALPGAAQSVRVTTGEHADFTRIVLQSRAAIDWSLTTPGRTRELRLMAGTLDFDEAEAFRRIPRTRLADLRRIDGGLELALDCDCEIRPMQPSPGLIILDIHDAADSPPAADQPRTTPPPRPRIPARPQLRALAQTPDATRPGDPARNAGTDLARRMRAGQQTTTAPDPAALPDEHAPMLAALSQQISVAIAQGLLSASAAANLTVRRAAEPALPGPELSNLRITFATDPRATAVPDPDALPDSCPAGDLLTFPNDDTAEPFRQRHAALMRALYGEFDLPERESHAMLARLYLEHGFGAEARVVIENAPAPIAGRDFLLGLSDILEDRYSNARLRLAEQIECASPTLLFAALAGAAPATIRPQASTIARAFGETTLPLRLVLGEPLVRRLLEADARDPARLVAETLRRATFPPPPMMPRVDAMIDTARGDVDRAAARLDRLGTTDASTLLMRLDLALDRGETVHAGLLADAQVLAAGERTTETGRRLMARVISLHNAADRPLDALPLLDRLASWLPATPGNDAHLTELRNETWMTLIRTAADAVFLQTVFERDDWSAGLNEVTKRALAARLLDFGLTDPAAPLLRDMPGDDARRLRARLLLLTGDPATALTEVAGLSDEVARSLQAEAHRQMGTPDPALSDARAEAAESEALAGALREAGNGGLMQRSVLLLSESEDLRSVLGAILDPQR